VPVIVMERAQSFGLSNVLRPQQGAIFAEHSCGTLVPLVLRSSSMCVPLNHDLFRMKTGMTEKLAQRIIF
jgi:hypothetical protein